MPATPTQQAPTDSLQGEVMDIPIPGAPRLMPRPGVTQVMPRQALRGVQEWTQGTLSVMEGKPGGFADLAIGTGVRAGLIGLGFYLTGTRDWKKLTMGSLAASGITTLVLLAGHAVVSRRTGGY